jgi:DNA-binding Xre family transcriptional regulator
MKVNSKLRIIVARKELADGRSLGIRTIAAEADTSVSTVQGLLNNKMKRVPLDDLAKLCKYFGVGVGDILEYSAQE